MSNFAASIWAKGQAKATEKFQEPEQRRKIPTVMGLALQNQEFSIPNAQELRKSPLRPVEIYFRKNILPGAGTTKSYNHTGTFGDTGLVTVTYVSHVEPIGVPLKIGANNTYSYEEVLADAIGMAWKNLRTRQDDSAIAFVYANRNQLTAAVMNAALQSAGLQSWNDTTKALEIPDSKKLLFIENVKNAMLALNYPGELDIIADIQSASSFMTYMNQGAGNQFNTGWQFEGINIARSQSVLDSNYSTGSVFALPKGLLAGLNWNEQLNKIGLPIPNMGGSIGNVGTSADPYGSGAIADVSYYMQRADTSANTSGGSTQDFVFQAELTLTIGYVTAPLSIASDSPIVEVSMLPGVGA